MHKHTNISKKTSRFDSFYSLAVSPLSLHQKSQRFSENSHFVLFSSFAIESKFKNLSRVALNLFETFVKVSSVKQNMLCINYVTLDGEGGVYASTQYSHFLYTKQGGNGVESHYFSFS